MTAKSQHTAKKSTATKPAKATQTKRTGQNQKAAASVAKHIRSTRTWRPSWKRCVIIGLSALIVIAALLFVFRGWIRTTIIPKTVSIFYAHGLQTTAQDELNKLDNPFALLGVANQPDLSGKCTLAFAQSLHTQVFCNRGTSKYAKLPTDSIGKVGLYQKSQAVQRRLVQNGWTVPGNDMSLSKLVYDNTHGVSSDPDATYLKSVGKDQCILSLTAAYGGKAAPAENLFFGCWRVMTVFGQPNLGAVTAPATK